MADGKSLRDDVAELAEAVRELRDREVAETIRELRAEIAQLRAERAGLCGCTHIHYQTCGGYQPYWNPVVTSTSSGYVTTNVAGLQAPSVG